MDSTADNQLAAEVGALSVAEIENIDYKARAYSKDPNPLDYAKYVVQLYYNMFLAELGNDISRELRNRSLLTAKALAFEWLNVHAHGLVDGAVMVLVEDAIDTAWPDEDIFIWSGIQEMFKTIVDKMEPESSGFYDFKFYTEQLVPMLKEWGYKPTDMLVASASTYKLRACVPTLRQILSQMKAGDISSADAKNTIVGVLDMVKDSEISRIAFKEFLDEGYRERSSLDLITGSQYLIWDTEEQAARWLIVLECNDSQAMVVNRKLEKVAQIRTRDIVSLLKVIASNAPKGLAALLKEADEQGRDYVTAEEISGEDGKEV